MRGESCLCHTEGNKKIKISPDLRQEDSVGAGETWMGGGEGRI